MVCRHIVHMASPKLVKAVQAALRASPVTLRELARRAGLSPSLTAYMKRGKRAATPAVAARLASALEGLAKEAAEGAKAIRRALRQDSK